MYCPAPGWSRERSPAEEKAVTAEIRIGTTSPTRNKTICAFCNLPPVLVSERQFFLPCAFRGDFRFRVCFALIFLIHTIRLRNEYP